MFLALREMSFARGRFVLMGSVVALIAVLMVLLSGLSVGLVNDGVSGLKKLPVSSFAFESGVDKSIISRFLHGAGLTSDNLDNLAAHYGSKGVPFYLMLDSDGKIAGEQLGSTGELGLRQLVANAIT